MRSLPRVVLCALLILPVLSSCAKAPGSKKLVIGLSLDTLKEERWQRDRDLFVERATELGATVDVQVANNDEARQASQCENLLTKGVDVLVVVAHNSESAATIVEAAHKAKVPVIAYDRLIQNCDLDLYVSFDGVRVGRLQAEYAVARVPKGRYLLIAGDPADHNSHLFRQGQLEVLQPLVDRGDIRLVGDQWAADWQPVEALKITENALTRSHNGIDAVVVSNDGLAGGVIQALAEQKLAGQVVVTGQDAELAGCQRILAGTQAMTVYKPLRALARRGAEVALALARGETVPDATEHVPNGFKDVPSVLIMPVSVDAANMDSTIVADGFHTKAALAGTPAAR